MHSAGVILRSILVLSSDVRAQLSACGSALPVGRHLTLRPQTQNVASADAEGRRWNYYS